MILTKILKKFIKQHGLKKRFIQCQTVLKTLCQCEIKHMSLQHKTHYDITNKNNDVSIEGINIHYYKWYLLLLSDSLKKRFIQCQTVHVE
jgi:hypothetical protein